MEELEIEVNGGKLKLDEVCINCDGKGRISENGVPIIRTICSACKGTGRVPTLAGETLMYFVLRYW